MMKLKPLLLAGALLFGATTAHATTTITSGPATGSVCCFGGGSSETYGQVFTAPITGTLTSFTLYLDDGVGDIFGGIGTWNGTASHSFGGGVSSLLYTSPTASGPAGPSPYTYTTSVAVTAGQLYVAFLSAFGTSSTGSTSMPTANAGIDPNVNYFVWNNSGNGGPAGASWNYFFNIGNAQFTATFTPVSAVPLPAALPLLAAGLGVMGAVARKRRRKAEAAA